MFARKIVGICSISVLALVTACSSNPRRSEPVAAAPGNATYATQFGNVSGIEMVPVASRSSGGGAVVGAVLGAVIGNQIGSGRAAATGLGAVGGAVIGNNVEKRSVDEIYRVSVRMDNGRIGQFDYQRIDDLRVGDRVKIEGGQLFRV